MLVGVSVSVILEQALRLSGRAASVASIILHLAACAATHDTSADAPQIPPSASLFDATTVIEDRWQHLPLRGKTEYRSAVFDGQVAIRAEGKDSASGIIRRVDIDPHACPEAEWSWSVAKLQSSADLRVKEREDVAASIFLLFGDPGFVSGLQPVPTLRYVWTNGKAAVDEVIDSPYLPGVVRSFVVRSGDGQAGAWLTERRNILEDFERAFGRPPEDTIHAVALFTDNDQTKEPVEAYYGAGRVICTRQPDDEKPVSIN